MELLISILYISSNLQVHGHVIIFVDDWPNFRFLAAEEIVPIPIVDVVRRYSSLENLPLHKKIEPTSIQHTTRTLPHHHHGREYEHIRSAAIGSRRS